MANDWQQELQRTERSPLVSEQEALKEIKDKSMDQRSIPRSKINVHAKDQSKSHREFTPSMTTVKAALRVHTANGS